jgi:methyl-accepting chemotaxis protein
VRTRIISVAVLASVLATCLFALPLGWAVRAHLLGQERGYLVREASDVAIEVAGDVEADVPVDRDALADVGEDGEDLTAAVFDRDGDLLAGSAPDRDVAVLWYALDGEVRSLIDDELVMAAVPVTHGEDVIGAVLVTEPRSQVLGEVGLVWSAMAGLVAAAVMVPWLVAREQARRLARPLEDLAVAARRLGQGDLSVRSAPSGIPEIDLVGAALDSTAVRLEDLLARERELLERERAFLADASSHLRRLLGQKME